MEVIDNTALKMTVPDYMVPHIQKEIDKFEVVGQKGNLSEVVIYWGVEEMTKLNQLVSFRKPLPSPIIRDYDWPGVFDPFDHQRITSEFLSINKRGFCFNEAGTGKTSSALWASDYLMKQGLIKRVLVICPLSIMYSAWEADVQSTIMHRTMGVAHGTQKKRELIIDEPFDFVCINYDGVGIVREAIANGNFDLIIIDEANAYKSPSTARWKTLAKIVKPETRLWLMTGTPAAQSPVDAYGLAKLVSPERVPKFSGAWRDKVMTQVTRFKWVPRSSAKDLVFKALQPAIRFAKNDCLDLPQVMYQTREVPLTPQATKYYKTLKDQLLFETGGEMVSAVNAASGLTKLLQISGGAVYTDKKDVIEFDIKPRLAALNEVIDETNEKILIFVPFRHTIELVNRHLVKQGYGCEIINGDVSANERRNIFNKFQNFDDPRVLIIQPQSASHGVTLTKADTVIFWSPVSSVEAYLQCIARIDRVGQKNKMTVVHLQGSEVERKMYAMLQGKVDAHSNLVDLYREVIA